MLNSWSLQHLPTEITMNILVYLDLPEQIRLSKTCRFWWRLGKQLDLFQRFCKHIYKLDVHKHQLRMEYEAVEREWSQFASRLDQGLTGFVGLCLDPGTAATPYTMELVVQVSETRVFSGFFAETIGVEACSIAGMNYCRVAEWGGFCRWKTLGDAMQGNIVDPDNTARFKKDSNGMLLPRHVVFEETTLIRGNGIAVPNRYYAVMRGPVLIGMFDPRNLALPGVFCVVMEETLFPFNTHLPSLVQPNTLHGIFFSPSPYPRRAHAVQMQIQDKIIFSMDMSPMETTVHSKSASRWAHFDMKLIQESETVFTAMFLLGNDRWATQILPTSPFSIQACGNIWIAMFSQPMPGCFYLE
ncbi:hypothetical protein EDD86DRAFT_245952 [Gorgonomyces haynaldii]|nr:hypothetical protein EDD86DRAFT_245952 [Gorgonomyces haynaldii]